MASANASTTALFSSSTTSLDSLLDDALHVQLAKLNRWGARLRKKYAKLSRGEVPWRGRYVWLKERGYQLRSRYSPDWKASWLENGTDWSLTAEDGGKFPYSPDHIIDATRIPDGRAVVVKRISKKRRPHEVEISQLLSSEPLVSDPRNHTVPILEVLDDPEDTDIAYIVMPMLTACYAPPFNTVGEVVAFFQQAIEGIQFMHQHNIAHRDLNILMEQSVWPEPRHYAWHNYSRDGSRRLKLATRTERPPKYYWTSLSLARKYDPAAGPRLEKPAFDEDATAPEHQGPLRKVPCDPMPTDVYFLGNIIGGFFLEMYENLEFMQALVDDMMRDKPAERPTMDEVVERFEEIRRKLRWWELRARVVPRRETRVEHKGEKGAGQQNAPSDKGVGPQKEKSVGQQSKEPVRQRVWRATDVFRTARYILKGLPAVPMPAN